ncbi:MAG: helix-turn-helix domain-containing protein [Ruminococcus sp.]|nr:helix-turn-helix domain-containing protein [Ruminococcus sp.]
MYIRKEVKFMKQVYTVAEIKEILGISKNAAYNFIRYNPPFRVVKIGETYRISKASFDKWLAETMDITIDTIK